MAVSANCALAQSTIPASMFKRICSIFENKKDEIINNESWLMNSVDKFVTYIIGFLSFYSIGFQEIGKEKDLEYHEYDKKLDKNNHP